MLHITETSSHDLLALEWPSPPRNVLLVCKENNARVDEALIEYAQYIHATYPGVNIICEPRTAQQLHESFSFPLYVRNGSSNAEYHAKVDLTTTLGGDGTILRAASLFATAKSVPPILSFSMGTLGFLGEWKFPEYKRAFREAYMSGAPSRLDLPATGATSSSPIPTGWDEVRGKSMGASRTARILLRNRLRVGIYSETGERLPQELPTPNVDTTSLTDNKLAEPTSDNVFALNEVLLHRGASPHLVHITIAIGAPPNERILTTAVADGILVSTPTGSTAYSLSSGGSIVHPLVSSLLLTPICPRSLSFRPLVLPANSPVTLRFTSGGTNRADAIEVSVDGVRQRERLRDGMEVRVVGEEVRSAGAPGARDWARGGVPCIVRSAGAGPGPDGEGLHQQDHWVGGLNGLLKFNYPFGEDP